MKNYFLFTISLFFILHGYPQANRVFSGGEAINFGTVDISLNDGTKWSSERSSLPGYFSLVENANYIGFSDKANIDGYIKKYGNTAFVFPVGTGKDLRTIEISKPNEITDAYATAWIEGNPSDNLDPTGPHAGKHSIFAVSGSIDLVSKAGQWDWQVGEGENLGTGTTGTGDGLVITASMPDMSAFADESELRLVGWNGLSWIDLSGKPTASGNKENSSISGTMIPGISAIAIGKIKSIPFVKLESIRAMSSDCNTILKWTTSFENTSSTFIIEQSTDAFNFYPIDSLPTSGSSTGNNYSKQFAQPIGIVYYRLKIKNSQGSFIYSSTVLWNNKCNEIVNMQVYPNPVKDNEKINLRFSTSFDGLADLMIINNAGQSVLKKSIQVKQGINLLSVDIQSIIHGNYFIKLIGLHGEQIGIGKQFIKQ